MRGIKFRLAARSHTADFSAKRSEGRFSALCADDACGVDRHQISNPLTIRIALLDRLDDISGNHRRKNKTALDWLSFICHARDLGIWLSDVHVLISLEGAKDAELDSAQDRGCARHKSRPN